MKGIWKAVVGAVAILQLVGCCTTAKRTAWQYKVVERSSVGSDYSGDLNALAKDGWEVVTSQLIQRNNNYDLSVVLRRATY